MQGQDGFSGPADIKAFTTVYYRIAHSGPYGHVIKIIQPLSQPSKDVGRFHAAASQPRVAITGQQVKLNYQRIYAKRTEHNSRSCGQTLIPILGAMATLPSKNYKLLNVI